MPRPLAMTIRHGTVAEFTERAQNEFLEIYQFRVFSQVSHAVLRDVVKEGRRFATGVTDPILGRAYFQDEFIEHLSTFDDRFILKMTFLQCVDIFEHWLRYVLRAVLGHPHRIYLVDKISPDSVLNARTLRDAQFAIVDKELDQVLRRRPSEWFKYIRKYLQVNLPAKDLIDEFQEIKATRDVWVHNNGHADQLYMEKSGEKARVNTFVGARLIITPEYHASSWRLLTSLCSELGAELSLKFDKQILAAYD